MLTKCFIIGNVGRKPELKMMPNGTEVCEFSVATREKKDDKPTFWAINAFAHSARFAAEYLDKGSLVLVEGHMRIDTWEKDGQKREKFKITASNIRGLGRKEADGNAKQASDAKEFTDPFVRGANAVKEITSQDSFDLLSIPF